MMSRIFSLGIPTSVATQQSRAFIYGNAIVHNVTWALEFKEMCAELAQTRAEDVQPRRTQLGNKLLDDEKARVETAYGAADNSFAGDRKSVV